MGRLCQGVGTVDGGVGKIIKGTDTFHVVRFKDIPKDRLKEVYYTSLVFEVRPGGKDSNRTRITIFGTNVRYPGDIGTKIASLKTFKIMININLF